MSILLQSSSYSHIYVCWESMTSCTFNTFPKNSGSWSLNQILKSHQPEDSRNLEQVSKLYWEFLKSYTIISLFYISIKKRILNS